MWRMVRTVLVTAVLVAGFALTPVGVLSHAKAGTTFSLGSLPSAVLATMGEPDTRGVGSLEDQTWYYGGSWVAFVEGYVREYVNSGNLKVRLGSKSVKPFFVWVGCHRATVIAALGTPTSVTRTTVAGAIWGYGNSSITMRDDKVVGWTDKGELKGHLRLATTAKALYNPWLASLTSAWWKTAATTYVPSVVVTSGTADWEYSSRRLTFYPSVPSTVIGGHPFIASNGSYYGQISEITGRPKTVWVSSYVKADGTFIRSHWRSLPGGH
jgi:hypothetical protein